MLSPPLTPHTLCQKPFAATTDGTASVQPGVAAVADAAGAAAAAAAASTVRVTRPRDKYAKVRKRLKCFSQQQLVEICVQFVQSSALSEREVVEATPRVDIAHLAEDCQAMRDRVVNELPQHERQAVDSEARESQRQANLNGLCKEEDMSESIGVYEQQQRRQQRQLQHSLHPPNQHPMLSHQQYAQPEFQQGQGLRLDATSFKKCKKNIATYRTGCVTIGKLLLDASLWVDTIIYCLTALKINDTMPMWMDEAHNKLTKAVAHKLAWFAGKAANGLSKLKGNPPVNWKEVSQIERDCRVAFPEAAAILRDLCAEDDPNGGGGADGEANAEAEGNTACVIGARVDGGMAAGNSNGIGIGMGRANANPQQSLSVINMGSLGNEQHDEVTAPVPMPVPVPVPVSMGGGGQGGGAPVDHEMYHQEDDFDDADAMMHRHVVSSQLANELDITI